jgi:hypothetical protein
MGDKRWTAFPFRRLPELGTVQMDGLYQIPQYSTHTQVLHYLHLKKTHHYGGTTPQQHRELSLPQVLDISTHNERRKVSFAN